MAGEEEVRTVREAVGVFNRPKSWRARSTNYLVQASTVQS